MKTRSTTTSQNQFTEKRLLNQATPPAGLSNVVAIATGAYHSVALKDNGTVVAWGDNGKGETNVPATLGDVVAISAEGQKSVALTSSGQPVAWGWEYYGQTNVPPDLTNAVAVAAGHDHALALRAEGLIEGWGRNDYSQATAPAGVAGVVAISGGFVHSAAIKSIAPRQAAATAQILNGFVIGFQLTDGGVGYTSVPNVQIIGGGGAGATAKAKISNGSVVGFTITSAGSGYSTVPTVVIDAPQVLAPSLSISPSVVNLTFSVTPTGKYLLETSVNGGPWVSSGIQFVADSDTVTQTYNLTSPNTQFRLTPIGARATAQVVNGFVVALNVTEGGGAYFTPPAVTISSPGASGVRAQATAQISNGVVTGFNIDNAGVGYTTAPTVLIAAPATTGSVSVSVARYTVTLNLTLGVTYRLESSNDLSAWTSVGDPFVATTQTVSIEVTPNQSALFFRVRESN